MLIITPIWARGARNLNSRQVASRYRLLVSGSLKRVGSCFFRLFVCRPVSDILFLKQDCCSHAMDSSYPRFSNAAGYL